MEKEFIPYELALELKKLGFNMPCLGGYDVNKKWWYHPDSDVMLDVPLWQQSFNWFREKGFYFEIYTNNNQFIEESTEWFYVIKKGSIKTPDSVIKTYEEARLECLKKLIEIVKNEPKHI